MVGVDVDVGVGVEVSVFLGVTEGVRLTVEVGVGISGVGEVVTSREGAGAVFLDRPRPYASITTKDNTPKTIITPKTTRIFFWDLSEAGCSSDILRRVYTRFKICQRIKIAAVFRRPAKRGWKICGANLQRRALVEPRSGFAPLTSSLPKMRSTT